MLRSLGSGIRVGGSRQDAGRRPLPRRRTPAGPHFPAKAKRVIFLFLNGGLHTSIRSTTSRCLQKYHGKPMPTENPKTERKTGNLLGSPFEFRKRGQSGLEVSDIFSQVGELIDDICVIRSMHTDRPFHDAGFFMMSTGHNLAGPPFHGLMDHLRIGDRESEPARFRGALPGAADGGTSAMELELSAGYVPGHARGEQGDGSREADPESTQL